VQTFPYFSAPNGTFFDPIKQKCTPAPSGGFTDTPTHFSNTFVDCLKAVGIVAGKTPTLFAPDDLTTRGELAVMAWNLLVQYGFVERTGPAVPFTDIATHFGKTQIEQLFRYGLVAGATATTYEPDRNITREELAVIASGVVGAITGAKVSIGPTPFTDLPVGSFGNADVARLYSVGVVTGKTATTYDPAGNATRGEIAVIMYQTMRVGTQDPLTAGLFGAQEVPSTSGDPDGSGYAIVTIDAGGNQLCYDLKVSGIDAATAAHIHTGVLGVSGPILVTFNPPSSGTSAGCLTTVGPSVLNGIEVNPAGFYVNVHNALYPNGAIRGQLEGV